MSVIMTMRAIGKRAKATTVEEVEGGPPITREVIFGPDDPPYEAVIEGSVTLTVEELSDDPKASDPELDL